MSRFISGVCCVIVGLQVLVGVPLAVCVAFLTLVHDGAIGTIEIRFQRGRSAGAEPEATLTAVTKPKDAEGRASEFEPILTTRQERGSMLQGTSLAVPAGEEEALVTSVLRSLEAEERALPPDVVLVPDLAGEEDLPCLDTLALGCAAQWKRLAAEQQTAGRTEQAEQYAELARQCTEEAARNR